MRSLADRADEAGAYEVMETGIVDELATSLRAAADEVDHWVRVAARLGERLDDAPHDRRCSCFTWNGKGWDVDEAKCDCWRSE